MNVLNKGTIGEQDFYTTERAFGDIDALIRGVSEEFLIGFARGEKLSITVSPKEDNLEFFFKTTYADSKVGFGSMLSTSSHAYDTAMSILSSVISEFKYEPSVVLDNESLAKTITEEGIEISNYCADLRIPVNDETIEILTQYKYVNNISKFYNYETKERYFEIPFAYEEGMYADCKHIDKITTEKREIPSLLATDNIEDKKMDTSVIASVAKL